MRQLISVLLIGTFYNCSAQKFCNTWEINNIKTNYVQKGIKDVYKIPNQLKNQDILIIGDSLIILTQNFKKKMGPSNLTEQFGDTIHLEKMICVQRSKDNDLNIMYPGDELTDCILQASDTCKASNNFLNLLGTKENKMTAYLSTKGKFSKTRCILFILKEGKQAVLYSENDFLLLFLSKK